MNTAERITQDMNPTDAAVGGSDTSEVKRAIRDFVSENFYVGEDDALTDDTSFLDMGIVDSTGILEVVAFLEDHFGIEVDDAELVPENLDSVAAIVAFVARKQAGGG